jgi:hypothetical protein
VFELNAILTFDCYHGVVGALAWHICGLFRTIRRTIRICGLYRTIRKEQSAKFIIRKNNPQNNPPSRSAGLLTKSYFLAITHTNFERAVPLSAITPEVAEKRPVPPHAAAARQHRHKTENINST